MNDIYVCCVLTCVPVRPAVPRARTSEAKPRPSEINDERNVGTLRFAFM